MREGIGIDIRNVQGDASDGGKVREGKDEGWEGEDCEEGTYGTPKLIYKFFLLVWVRGGGS